MPLPAPLSYVDGALLSAFRASENSIFAASANIDEFAGGRVESVDLVDSNLDAAGGSITVFDVLTMQAQVDHTQWALERATSEGPGMRRSSPDPRSS